MAKSLPKYTKSEFYAEIRDTVSIDYGVGVTIRESKMDRILRDALRTFYSEYDGADEDQYIVIQKKAFRTPLFRQKRQIELPDCINAVYGLSEGNNYLGVGNEDKDYRKNRFQVGRAVLGSSQDLVYGIATAMYNDFVNQFDLRTVSFDYSELTNRLTIIGRTPVDDLVGRVSMNIEEGALYRDRLFFNYVLGQALKRTGGPLSVFDFKLIGGTSVNTSDMKNEGQKLIDEVMARFDEQRTDSGFWMEDDEAIW